MASLQIKPISDLETLRARWGEIMAKYRTALLNCKYNAHRLRIKKTQNLWFEIILALGTSSAIGGWTVFKTEPGKPFWAVFSAIVVVLTIVKPIFQIPKEIERFSELHIGYKNLYYELNKLVSEVNKTGSISDATQTAFEKAKDRLRELSLKDTTLQTRNYYRSVKLKSSKRIPLAHFGIHSQMKFRSTHTLRTRIQNKNPRRTNVQRSDAQRTTNQRSSCSRTTSTPAS